VFGLILSYNYVINQEIFIMFHKNSFPSFIKKLRKNLRLSQEGLAREVGVSFATVNRWENGLTRPSPLAIKQIEDILWKLGDRGEDLLEIFIDLKVTLSRPPV